MPRMIGRFVVGKTTDERGAFGKVRRGYDTVNNIPVTVRILDKELVSDNGIGASLKREVGVMKLVNHKNILRLVEVLASQAKIYIVLESVGGGELFDKIATEGRVTEEEARRYFSQLIAGVEHCHQRGVAHRDLKPENLLLDDNGDLKISDFGLSALYGGEAQEGLRLLHTTCGTPNYVAPEVLSDQGYDGRKADIWSCGVVLYVLLAGFLPFDEPTMSELFRKVQNADFCYPRWFSPLARSLLDTILVVDPVARPSFAQMRKHPWMKAGNGKSRRSSDSPTSSVGLSSSGSLAAAENDNNDKRSGGGAAAAGDGRGRPPPVVATLEAEDGAPMPEASPLSIDGAVPVQEEEVGELEPAELSGSGGSSSGTGSRADLGFPPVPAAAPDTTASASAAPELLAATPQYAPGSRQGSAVAAAAAAGVVRFAGVAPLPEAELAGAAEAYRGTANAYCGEAESDRNAARAYCSAAAQPPKPADAAADAVADAGSGCGSFALALGRKEAAAAVAEALAQLGWERRVLSGGAKIKACRYSAADGKADPSDPNPAAEDGGEDEMIGVVMHLRQAAGGADAASSGSGGGGSGGSTTHVDVKLAAGRISEFTSFCDALLRGTSLAGMLRAAAGG